MGGHQQHRQVRVTNPQCAQQLVAVHARHVDVTDHQIEGLFGRHAQRLFRRADSFEIVTGQQQRIGQCLAQRAVILDQQNLDCH
ncbi:hypothetical protein D3C84_604820 [compost metagenome]